eukprot:SAG11_NODE_60_length_19094_cov_26.549566_15_plen_90_part_00
MSVIVARGLSPIIHPIYFIFSNFIQYKSKMKQVHDVIQKGDGQNIEKEQKMRIKDVFETFDLDGTGIEMGAAKPLLVADIWSDLNYITL